MEDTGYECGKCGYEPTYAELQRGVCPGCRTWEKKEED